MAKFYLSILCLSCLFFSFFLGKKKIKAPEGFVFVPSQVYINHADSVDVDAFFMANHEVTNAEYREFLTDFKKVEKDQKVIRAVAPDTLAWIQANGFTDVFSNVYFWHPAYDNYPVVNVSHKGAEMYCEWLTNKLRGMYGEQIADVRIPSEVEWKVAASGGSNGPYPWGGPYLRNSKGHFLANFLPIGDHMITQNKDGEFTIVNDSIRAANYNRATQDITAPSLSYSPNGYGLYHMSGNVAELCAENKALGGHWKSSGYDIRIESEIPFEKPCPFIGFRPIITFLSSN